MIMPKFKINDVIYMKNEFSYNPCYKAFHISKIDNIYLDDLTYTIKKFNTVNISETDINLYNNNFNIKPKFFIDEIVKFKNQQTKILAITYLSGEEISYDPRIQEKPKKLNKFKYILSGVFEEVPENLLKKSI